ncbi:sulfate/molybdate ABC transporter ATP-binding protein [Youngiibacter fragilis]|uniref:ABC transporter n=1 Tax=Youngiibacter fragilis 232.1 TaxID=994573 RepID=V7I6A3_9CLOT|nr:sulfate/molybdate ABC transporter ATP-binding protein [Youngiibacter fragilis]ETA80527.1 ABC transporter [Youngiibacter fragilis 232.1]
MSLIVEIRKSLGQFQLDVSFQTEREILALLGASGCGKSLTLKCIAGIETPDEGYIELNGRILFDSRRKINLTPQMRRVGYLFQQYALFPNMTVAQNIACGVPDKFRSKEVVIEKISAFQLNGMEKKYPHQLSGGQMQRVALARILASEPELLLLDEPFSALDSYLKWQMELELDDTLSSFDGTAIFVSHSRDEVYRLCDSVSVLNCGRSETKIPVKSLFEDPRTLSSCLLSGCKNYSRIKVSGIHVEALDWGVTLEVNREIPIDAKYLGVRSRSFIPSLKAGCNSIHCKVERVMDDVFTTVVMLSTPAGKIGYSVLRMEISKAAWTALSNPSELYLHIDPANIMLLRD